MDNLIDDDVLRGGTKLWGQQFQFDMLTEESAELIQAISHLKRGRCNIESVIEEMADVTILLRQVVIDQDVEALLEGAIAAKMMRLERRVEENNPNWREE